MNPVLTVQQKNDVAKIIRERRPRENKILDIGNGMSLKFIFGPDGHYAIDVKRGSGIGLTWGISVEKSASIEKVLDELSSLITDLGK